MPVTSCWLATQLLVGCVCTCAGWLKLATPGSSAAVFKLAAAGAAGPLTFGIMRASNGSTMVCDGSRPAQLISVEGPAFAKISLSAIPVSKSSTSAWYSLPFMSTWDPNSSSLDSKVTVGDPFGNSVTGTVSRLWVSDTVRDCTSLASWLDPTKGTMLQLSNQPPTFTTAPGLPGGTDVFIGDDVTVTARATDSDGDPVRVRVTFYGVPAPECTTASCGDHIIQLDAPAGGVTATHLNVTAVTAYLRAGRYVIRVEAVDFHGGYVSKDLELLVRKQGDIHRQARCCRQTGSIVTAQGGRPTSQSTYNDTTAAQNAAALGWPTTGGSGASPSQTLGEYLRYEDQEAERLFDWGVLAPMSVMELGGLWQVVTCADTRVAGAGSQRVVGWASDQYTTNHGHGKRLLVVPQVRCWCWRQCGDCCCCWCGMVCVAV